MKQFLSFFLLTSLYAGQSFAANFQASLLHCVDTVHNQAAQVTASYAEGRLLTLHFKSQRLDSSYQITSSIYEWLRGSPCLTARPSSSKLCAATPQGSTHVGLTLELESGKETFNCELAAKPEQPGIVFARVADNRFTTQDLYLHSVHTTLAHELATHIDQSGQDPKGLYIYSEQSSCVSESDNLVNCAVSYRYRHWFGELDIRYKKLRETPKGAIWKVASYFFSGQS